MHELGADLVAAGAGRHQAFAHGVHHGNAALVRGLHLELAEAAHDAASVVDDDAIVDDLDFGLALERSRRRRDAVIEA